MKSIKSCYLSIKDWFVKNGRKAGLALGFSLSTYKGLDYRNRYIQNEETLKIVTKDLVDKMEENKDLSNTYSELLLKLKANFTINDIKLPLWFKVYDKDKDVFRMVQFNKAYKDVYGSSAVNYFGKPDDKVIDKEIGEQYQNNDKLAYEANGEVLVFFEEYYSEKEKRKKIGKYAKWRVDKDGLSYIYGIQLEL